MLSPDLQRLQHIAEYCEAIQQTMRRYGAEYEIYLADADYQRSVSFSILQIGELGGKLSEDFRNLTDREMPWAAIKYMRNLVVHSYGQVDHAIIWDTMVSDVPKLLEFCNKHLGRNN